MAFDIFMIAYGEPNAAENWARLRSIAPEARLIENVPGIYEAYGACAAASRTPYFFAVDADNWVKGDFDFSIPFEPREDEIASWGAVNPINGLCYGHGSIKLLPKALFGRARPPSSGLDLVMSLSKRLRFVDIPASEHRFNTDPRTTWSVAFRECVKLAMMICESTPRSRAFARRNLEVWCSRAAEGQFANWCLSGAREGRAYALAHRADPAALQRINDYAWMRTAFAKFVESGPKPPVNRLQPVPAGRRPAGPPSDVFMIAYGEPNAAENWARLRSIAPEAKLIENVRGIEACYIACAAAARTPFFFAVDADNWMLDGFRFETPPEPAPDEIVLWYALNPVNGLRYAHGAIKLVPTDLMRGVAEGKYIDLPTSVSRNRYTEVCASEHRFNGDAYSTWAAAFRECAKLAMGTTVGGFKARALAKHRLSIWCTQAAPDAKFGTWCLRGAQEGRRFGLEHKRDFDGLNRINDFDWLRARFRATHVRKIAIPTVS